MSDKIPECPLIFAGVMAGKSGYSACRRFECAWWDLERRMCCIAAAARQPAEAREKERTIVESLHLYDQEEIFPDCTVQVLRNSVTGATSVGWWENQHEQ